MNGILCRHCGFQESDHSEDEECQCHKFEPAMTQSTDLSPEELRVICAEADGYDLDPPEAREWKSRGQWAKAPNDEFLTSIHHIPRYHESTDIVLRLVAAKLHSWDFHLEKHSEFPSWGAYFKTVAHSDQGAEILGCEGLGATPALAICRAFAIATGMAA